MMDKSDKKKLIIAGVIIAILLISWFVMFLSSRGGEKKATPDSLVAEQTIPKETFDNSSTSMASTTTTTRPDSTPDAAKAKLNELPLTAHIDMNYPEQYLSYRYSTIIDSEFSGDEIEDTYLYDKIAITELDDPANSDLAPALFSPLRALSINVAKAQATGVNVAAYPDYFTAATYVDKCTNFSPQAAGAISMPYPGDDSWALGVVYWKASCVIGDSKSSPVTISSHQIIYLHRGANGWVAVPASSIPRNPVQ